MVKEETKRNLGKDIRDQSLPHFIINMRKPKIHFGFRGSWSGRLVDSGMEISRLVEDQMTPKIESQPIDNNGPHLLLMPSLSHQGHQSRRDLHS